MNLKIRSPSFDLKLTLESGQFFRWRPDGDRFVIVRGPRLFRARQTSDAIVVEGASRPFVRNFFSLDHDLAATHARLRRDPRLRPALDACRGLRILRQDPWECTAAFITSAASNIPRITRNLGDVAARWGRPLRLGDVEVRTFPAPEELGSEKELRRLGLGYRARYLADAPRWLSDGLLKRVGRMATPEAREALMTLPGVAEKVADCILLFAYGRGEAFPIDTWIRKMMIRLFFRGRRVTDREIRAFAADRWGERAGYAQQVLFTWGRAGVRGRRRGPAS